MGCGQPVEDAQPHAVLEEDGMLCYAMLCYALKFDLSPLSSDPSSNKSAHESQIMQLLEY
jgi:hypothetical protein